MGEDNTRLRNASFSLWRGDKGKRVACSWCLEEGHGLSGRAQPGDWHKHREGTWGGAQPLPGRPCVAAGVGRGGGRASCNSGKFVLKLVWVGSTLLEKPEATNKEPAALQHALRGPAMQRCNDRQSAPAVCELAAREPAVWPWASHSACLCSACLCSASLP